MIEKDKFIEKAKDFSLTLYSITSTFSLATINFSLGFMLLLTMFKISKERLVKISNKIISYSVIIFLFAISISMINSFNFENSLDYLNRFFYPFIAFFIIRLNNLSLKKIKKYSFLILLSIFLNLIYGYYQYFDGARRIHGALFVMEFAGLLAFLVIFCFIYIWNPESNKKNKYFLSLIFIAAIIGVVLTGTRGIWIALTFTVCVLVFLLDKKQIFKFILIFLLVSLIIFMFMPDYYSNRLTSIFDINQNNSNLTRLNLWRGAILIFKDNPINGIGLNNFSEIIGNNPYHKNPMGSKAHAHNNYLQLLAETGIIGLMAFLFLNYKVIMTLFSLIKKTRDNFNKYYYYFVFGMYINYLFQGLTEYNLVDRYINIVLWIFIGFAINISEIEYNGFKN